MPIDLEATINKFRGKGKKEEGPGVKHYLIKDFTTPRPKAILDAAGNLLAPQVIKYRQGQIDLNDLQQLLDVFNEEANTSITQDQLLTYDRKAISGLE